MVFSSGRKSTCHKNRTESRFDVSMAIEKVLCRECCAFAVDRALLLRIVVFVSYLF
jgi:hypothetical protein